MPVKQRQDLDKKTTAQRAHNNKKAACNSSNQTNQYTPPPTKKKNQSAENYFVMLYKYFITVLHLKKQTQCACSDHAGVDVVYGPVIFVEGYYTYRFLPEEQGTPPAPSFPRTTGRLAFPPTPVESHQTQEKHRHKKSKRQVLGKSSSSSNACNHYYYKYQARFTTTVEGRAATRSS